MKLFRIIIFIGATFFVQNASAQLAGTKWAGTFQIPGTADCYFQFKKDTLNMIMVESEGLVEQMHYELKSDTIFLKKLNGGSPCEVDNVASYKWKVTGDKLFLNMISDDCPARSGAGIDGAEMTKVVEPGSLKKE